MYKYNKKVKGGGLYQDLANRLGGTLGENEIHAPIYTKKGWKFASYMGPQTELYDNIRKGKKPVSKSDTVAQAHDLRYSMSKTPKDVRAADLKMINKLDDLQKKGEDYKVNILMGKLPIKLKMWAEDRGIIKPGSFSSMKGVPPEEKDLAEETLGKLEAKGYGKKKPSAWNLHVSEVKKKNPGKSFKEVLKLASSSYKSLDLRKSKPPKTGTSNYKAKNISKLLE